MRLRAALGLILVAITSMCDAEPHAPPDPLGRVGFDQHLAQQVPLDASFHDESGKRTQRGHAPRGAAIALLSGEKCFWIGGAKVPCGPCCFRGVHEGLRLAPAPEPEQPAPFPSTNAVFAIQC